VPGNLYPGGASALKGQLALLAGNFGGSLLGDLVAGGASKYGSTGATLGSTAGFAAFGPVGALVGGAVGGILGGLFGKKDNKKPQELSALQLIERNTREAVEAIRNQTQLMTLDDRLIGVPATYAVPRYRPLGVGAGPGTGQIIQQANTVTIQVTGATDPEATARAVKAALTQELRQQGTFNTSRY
jgi:hypothetical protein